MINLSFGTYECLDDAVKRNVEFNFSGNVGIIKNNEQIIGFFDITIKESEIELNTLEIFEEYQNKGYGRDFILELFNTYPQVKLISGQSNEDSVPFYSKVGADFEDSCENCEYTDCIYNPDYAGEEDENTDEDTCDDYTENIFKIYKPK